MPGMPPGGVAPARDLDARAVVADFNCSRIPWSILYAG
jgi:hypothetical protein